MKKLLSKVGYFSKIAEIFITALTTTTIYPKATKVKKIFQFFSTWDIYLWLRRGRIGCWLLVVNGRGIGGTNATPTSRHL